MSSLRAGMVLQLIPADLNARLDALLNDTNDPGTAREATLLGATDSLLTKIDRSLYRNDEKFKRVKIILDDFKSDNDTKKSTAYKYDLIEVQQSLKHTLTGPEEDLLTYIAHKHRPFDELILVWATFEDRFLNTRSGSSESIYTNPDTSVDDRLREIGRLKEAMRQLPRHSLHLDFKLQPSGVSQTHIPTLKRTLSFVVSKLSEPGRAPREAMDGLVRTITITASNSTLLNEVDALMSNLCEGNVQAAISDYDNGQLSSLLMQTREWDCGNANTNKIYNDQMVNLWGTLKELQSCVIGQTASQDQPIEEAHAIEI
ncbi:hypothetical protein L486_08436 [Kwoniella mangroviensis CBS 10435]|uniref:Uncharacterized protein n=1 Tax=Kwoniella mangroviensis CBS 10435 TaxID=1331196 RepID=A0A1B9IF30_9TREE|nr:hypothetical protein L486_08436 [Kwoniella mangroviensis CBS 10435]